MQARTLPEVNVNGVAQPARMPLDEPNALASLIEPSCTRNATGMSADSLGGKVQSPRRQTEVVMNRITTPKPVPETTSLFALLWRTRMIRHKHAASHVPSDTAGEHDTSTPVLVRPRGRAPLVARRCLLSVN